MRLDNERPSTNVEDQRGQGGFGRPGGVGGGFGFPGGGGGRGINIPIGAGRGGFSLSTIILLVVVYFAIKLLFGIDLIEVMSGGGYPQPTNPPSSEVTVPNVPSVPIGKNSN
jgi:predicted metalloprotease